ncbi:hypothetical protein HDU76_007107 [Blyttiomyces sp. JEL0837]|nr:hypothetical protein HDU76_007107 [Blyttiomyces sp. JEL0837]
MTTRESIAKQLAQQLFNGLNPGLDFVANENVVGDDKEFLILHVKVNEDSSKSDDRTPARRSSMTTEDDDGSVKNVKVRYICKKSSKGTKIRLHKVKFERNSYAIGKSWSLDDVKTLESGKDTQMTINLGKPYVWTLEESSQKIELLYSIVTLSRKYIERIPKLVNLDEELLADQMQLLQSSRPKSAPTPAKQTSATDAHPSTMGFINKEPTIHEEDDVDHVLKTVDIISKKAQQAPAAVDLKDLLEDFSWQTSGDAADLENRLVSELQALEGANVHAIFESEDQANVVIEHIDIALQELESVDKWLQHYTDLLDQMGQDVRQVEVRNKAMQITTSNQKVLQSEINAILASLKLPGFVLEVLRNEPLDDPNGISECERATSKLMEVIKTKFDESIGDICMISERLSLYNGYARQFSVRLADALAQLISSLADNCLSEKTRMTKKGTKVPGLDALQLKLSRYRKLMKWLKDVDTRKHHDIEMVYCQELSKVYRRDIHDHIENIKNNNLQRKVLPEEQTYWSKALGGSRSNMSEKKRLKIPSLTRKKNPAPVDGPNADDDEDNGDNQIGSKHKRSASIASSQTNLDADTDKLIMGTDKLWPDEAIAYLYVYLCPLLMREQNYAMDFFNIRSKSDEAAEEVVESSQHSLNDVKEKFKDVKIQKRLQEMSENIFGDIRDLVHPFIDSCLKYDVTFSVGMMVRIEECIKGYENSAYTFLLVHLETVLSKLNTSFERFVDEQLKSIEETKVTLKKRSGILPFIKTFPLFVDRMEKCLEDSDGHSRTAVSKCYSRLVKTIFDTLEAVAKEANTDPKDSKNQEDKESLNIYILTVENMHYFYTEIRGRKVAVLDQFMKAAKTLYDLNVENYVKIVIRKPLGKLLEFFEGIDDLLKSLGPEEISFHLQYSKVALKDVLKKFPAKEIKKGLEQLYKRVEKHFSDEVGGLLQVVWRGIQSEYTKQLKRYEELIALCYSESGLKIELTMEDLLSYFSELARMH